VAALACGAVLFFVDSAPNSPYERPWAWGGRDVVDAAREEAADLVPLAATVAASPQMTELVAERPVLDQLSVGPPSRASTRDFEAIALDTTGTTDSGLPLWTDADLLRVLDALRDQGYRVRFRAAGIFVLTR
jgi:2-phospho-L-lactate guanylyltransferase (CobY/MobA/RfbA family)